MVYRGVPEALVPAPSPLLVSSLCGAAVAIHRYLIQPCVWSVGIPDITQVALDIAGWLG